MTQLVLTSVTPTLRSGAGLRTYGVVAALAQHDDVEVAYIAFGHDQPASEYDALHRVTLRGLQASRGLGRGLAYFRARSRHVPSDLARGVSPELADGARQAGPGVRLIADGPVAAAAVLPLARKDEVVYLAHNLESGFRSASGRGDLARFERSLLETFSECWMATRSDEAGAAVLAPGVRTRYVPNVVDVKAIEPVRPSGTECVLFVGDFTYEPNREGLGYLVDDVLPIAWKQRPRLRLLVAGRGLTSSPEGERVQVLGFVDDLRTAYAAADVVVVPLLHGGGSPLKFVEALAYSLPVIATDHAARLLKDAVAGRDFLAASDPSAFAAQINRVLSNPGEAENLGDAGRKLAQDCYSVEALARLLVQ
jgi:polysaccharide biosynthesis protein PslH